MLYHFGRRKACLDFAVAALRTDLGDSPGLEYFGTIEKDLRIDSLDQLRQVVGPGQLPAVFVLDPGTIANTSDITSIGGDIPEIGPGVDDVNPELITTFTMHVVGLSSLAKGDHPGHDVYAPAAEIVAGTLLRDPSMGGNAMSLQFVTDAHTGHTLGDRLAWEMVWLVTFGWWFSSDQVTTIP